MLQMKVTAPTGRVVDRDANHCQLILDNVFLTYTIGQATKPNISSMVSNLELFFSGLDEDRQAAYVLVTKGTAKPPAADSRTSVQRVFTRYSARIAAIAIVIEVPGFAGAALRAVASTLFVLAQRRLHVKFFSETAGCVDWVSGRAQVSPDGLLRLFDQAEALVGR